MCPEGVRSYCPTSSGESEDEEEGEGAKEDKGTGEEPEGGAKSTGTKKLLRNQFNFSERASQTLNNPLRVGLVGRGVALWRGRGVAIWRGRGGAIWGESIRPYLSQS